jgi:hypothetical protein
MNSVSRRTKFLISTIFYLFGILFFDFANFSKYIFLGAALFVVFIINLIALYPGYKLRDVVLISYLPLVLVSSTILGLIFFPNLSAVFKYLLMFFSGAFFYLSMLINNLIIAEKIEDTSLPLFRVGQVWLQILLIILTIPFITVVYKFNLHFYFHSLAIFVYLFISSYVYLHTYLISKTDQVSTKEYILLLIEMTYLPLVASIATSFIPAESFFRATFVTSVYMAMVSYARNYIDNSLNKKLLIQYLVICTFFLLVLIVFKP